MKRVYLSFYEKPSSSQGKDYFQTHREDTAGTQAEERWTSQKWNPSGNHHHQLHQKLGLKQSSSLSGSLMGAPPTPRIRNGQKWWVLEPLLEIRSWNRNWGMRKLAAPVIGDVGGSRGMEVLYRESDIPDWGVLCFKAASFSFPFSFLKGCCFWHCFGQKFIEKSKLVLPIFLRNVWHSWKIIVIRRVHG